MKSLTFYHQSKQQNNIMLIGILHLIFLSIEGFTVPSKPTSLPTFHQKEAFQRRSVPSTSAKTLLLSSATEELAPGIKAIKELNPGLEEKLNSLREKPYFRLYSVDMLGSCEYIPQELFECYSETCEIYPVEEEDIPEAIREVDMDEHDFELDGWARWDMPSDDYYDTSQFPEEFTAYDGSEVWRFIHDRIAFHDATITDEYDSDNWKADFNKAVSGMHSMISAQIVEGIANKIESGEGFTEDCAWTDPKAEFERRLGPNGETPQAIENLYFGYMLLLSAARTAKGRLLQDAESGKLDAEAAGPLKFILEYPLLNDKSIRIASKKLHDHAVKDEESVNALWEARLRTRDLFRIMNCVQCNKCRLHGKISAMGLSTAFQLLLGEKGEGGDVKRVHRVELAALMTTLSKFSTAINFCEKMKST